MCPQARETPIYSRSLKKSRTPTVAKEFQIGLYDPAEADLEHFWNCCSAGFLGERLYRTRASPESETRTAIALMKRGSNGNWF